MREIRVLVVDDSVTVRHALHEALEGEDGEIVARTLSRSGQRKVA